MLSDAMSQDARTKLAALTKEDREEIVRSLRALVRSYYESWGYEYAIARIMLERLQVEIDPNTFSEWLETLMPRFEPEQFEALSDDTLMSLFEMWFRTYVLKDESSDLVN